MPLPKTSVSLSIVLCAAMCGATPLTAAEGDEPSAYLKHEYRNSTALPTGIAYIELLRNSLALLDALHPKEGTEYLSELFAESVPAKAYRLKLERAQRQVEAATALAKRDALCRGAVALEERLDVAVTLNSIEEASISIASQELVQFMRTLPAKQQVAFRAAVEEFKPNVEYTSVDYVLLAQNPAVELDGASICREMESQAARYEGGQE